MAVLPLIDRIPTFAEFEKLRLILSTYQDGSGMVINHTRKTPTIPGWRDFERTVAIAFNGHALESKHVYDVLLADKDGDYDLYYGISCKMRGTLRQVEIDGRVTIEFSNASGGFWDVLKTIGIHQQNYHEHAKETGVALVQLVEDWHNQVDITNGGKFNSAKSIFLILQYHPKKLDYQLFRFPLQLRDANTIDWSVDGRRLIGKVNGVVLWEWYGFSGGQLKYYPHYSTATWISDVFKLEPLPKDQGDYMINKVKAYFPEKWAIVEQAEKA